MTRADFRVVDKSRIARRDSTHRSATSIARTEGFTLIELLVALVVFAAMAAAAYGGLAQIARARGALAAQQDRFAAITRAVGSLERDLRQAVGRPGVGNNRETLNALSGGAGGVEFTHLGFANPRAEPRSNLERVVYSLGDGKLTKGRYAVLDRAPDSAPANRVLVDRVSAFYLRYLGCDGVWRDAWPAGGDIAPCEGTPQGAEATLPRSVEFRLVLADLGEVRRVVDLPASMPAKAAAVPGNTPPPAVTPTAAKP